MDNEFISKITDKLSILNRIDRALNIDREKIFILTPQMMRHYQEESDPPEVKIICGTPYHNYCVQYQSSVLVEYSSRHPTIHRRPYSSFDDLCRDIWRYNF